MSFRHLLALRPTSLKQKTAIFILLPTFLIMVGIGGLGLHLVRQVLLGQWQETAITKLERSAHYVDMRLMRPKELLRFLQQKDKNSLQWDEIKLLLEQLRSFDGVVQVNQEWTHVPGSLSEGTRENGGTHHLEQLTLSPPRYNSEFMSETVSMLARFKDSHGNSTGRIEVVLSFYDLIDQIVKSPWWKSNEAFIVDQERNILTSTILFAESPGESQVDKFGRDDDQQSRTWEAMQRESFGTVFSPGMPPDKVSGFYRLSEVPWTLVITSPGEQVLEPILQFRTYYFLISGTGILLALLYLLVITEKTTRSINKLSTAADDLARGSFTEPLIVDSRDEVGKLTTSFNVMADQLQERIQLQAAMSVAREVQQNLLFHEVFTAEGLEIAGKTLYCDATGGDFIDLLHASTKKQKATVVVGDVVGHGIGAALLMTTVRALVRGRAKSPGTLAEVADDVNSLLCRDTTHSGNFATLFCLEVDRLNSRFNWIRCGHEPALVYLPGSNRFTELRGEGLVLGFDDKYSYQENEVSFHESNQIILVGSDGVWDVENEAGEMFGRDRAMSLLLQYQQFPAGIMIQKISESISAFRKEKPQNDDITLAIIKTW